jgi:hypothetical protein
VAANLNEMVHRLCAQIRNNAVAYTALFVALGGTGLAASSALPRNSVGTPQLKSRAVTGAKIALRAVTGANVAKATLTGANIRSSTLGTVPNAGRLGGLSPLSFQRAITNRCVGNQGVQAVAQKGRAACHSFGTITGITAATGLTGGGASGHVSLAVDPTVVQARVTASCAAGRAISSIKQDGSIGCHIADVTQMMGGTGTATLDPASAFIAPVGVSTPNAQVQAVAVGSADLPSTARHLSVKVATAPPSGGSWRFNFYVNGRIRTGLGCVITSPERSCHSGGSVSIPRGARIALHETGTNITVGTTATFGWTDTTF